ncbi:ATP-binding cassette domain-containing protein [Bradyrhizobium hipponense]|uniref:ATP-binding cassette domain-containing protein n=1 Tax=Bradyrhizobium hipponense TaxID=2605638 RepID=A0A5S4YX92_9BRAD|nr:ATP-binding cassette domain-containing protein [Bradyrhizobium hipponense]
MLSGRVAQPILRLSQLWQDFQQVRISVDRLGDVLNAPAEPDHNPNRASLPPIKGAVNFDRVRFRYRPDAPEALRGITLAIQPGEMIGIVGPSGSGKSTLTKLVQRLYVPEQGRVLVDGVDLALVDPAWLRRQIGVVLQENILFNRSVRENIALSDTTMPMERVIAAAQLAGAHDFILGLSHGYDTVIDERGGNLSGGQRQRMAIARALIGNPRILILDEATSALDAESEEIIQHNLAGIARGRAVIIIAHRLSAVRQCDRIVTVEAGEITETGDHQTLLRSGGEANGAQHVTAWVAERFPALAKHWAVLRASWSMQNEADRNRRPLSDHEFLPAALEIMEKPPSPGLRMLLLMTCGFFTAALVWSIIGSVDVVAVASGKIIPSSKVKTIQPMEIGSVRAIHVANVVRVEIVGAALGAERKTARTIDVRHEAYKRTSEDCQLLTQTSHFGTAALLRRARIRPHACSNNHHPIM